jgi:lysophospholipase L1-like esterase
MLRHLFCSPRPSASVLVGLLAFGAAGVGCSGTDSPSTEGQAGTSAALGGSSTGGAGSPSSSAGMPGAGAGQTMAGTATTGGAAGSPTGGAPSGGGGAGAGAGSLGGATTGGGGAAGSSDGGDAEVPLDAALLGKCSGTNPIVCTFAVPTNGNYTVTVELGGTNSSRSRVQAEEHRISVPTLQLDGGKYSKHTFSLNVREEKHDGYGAPEKVLNLLIDNGGDNSQMVPMLHGVGFAATPNIPTIFVAGDSTVCDWEPTYAATKAGPLERGWAQEFSQFLKPGIAVANYADSGETASGFYGKFWTPAKALLREGDYVFIEFGHNDQGDFTAEQFKTNMKKYVTDALAAKAVPVLFTPLARKSASMANPGFAGLDQATRDLAAAEKVALVDLTNMTLTYYSSAGVTKAELFATTSEGTHLGEYGATQVSKLVADYLKTTTLGLKTLMR